VQQVEVRIKGHVDRDWSDWITALTVSHTTQGETVLSGSVRDQSALHGLLDRVAGLGIELIAVSTQRGSAQQQEGGTRS
jgi:hypothetical protein